MAEPGFVAALRDPRAFPHPCSHVRLIETHISWVFLTGEYAYKLKKTLDLGFFDFGTLEKRRHYCEEECRCNSAFAPELYLGVVAVRLADDDRYHIGGAGRVVEYAVKMRQFDDRKQLDRVLERNALTPAMLKRFARSLAAIYAALPPVPRYTGSAGADRILAPMLENFLVLEGVAQARPYAPGLTRVRDWTAAMHERLRARFEERAVAGCIRERHGDLHLSNLVDTDEGIRAFDCVEFNPELRMIDAISDIAFLFMDCSVRGRQDLAYSFLDSYLEATADYPGACLLRFYAVYRSMVRAKVAALRLGQAFDQPTQRRLERHITWAGRTISAVAPTVVLMCGPSGSGKSWLAERLAPLLPGIRIRSDIVRRERAPGSPPGKGYLYHRRHRGCVYTFTGPDAGARRCRRSGDRRRDVLVRRQARRVSGLGRCRRLRVRRCAVRGAGTLSGAAHRAKAGVEGGSVGSYERGPASPTRVLRAAAPRRADDPRGDRSRNRFGGPGREDNRRRLKLERTARHRGPRVYGAISASRVASGSVTAKTIRGRVKIAVSKSDTVIIERTEIDFAQGSRPWISLIRS